MLLHISAVQSCMVRRAAVKHVSVIKVTVTLIAVLLNIEIEDRGHLDKFIVV